MRRIRLTMAAFGVVVMAVAWLMAAGQPVSAAGHMRHMHQAAPRTTATPAPTMSATTTGPNTSIGGNPGVNSAGPTPSTGTVQATVPNTGAGGTSGTSTGAVARLPKTGGGDGDNSASILPSLVLALLGLALVMMGRSLRASRR